VTEVLPGIHLLRLPLTGSPLKWVNGYLLKADDGWVLVDCGWDMPDVMDALVAQLGRIGAVLHDIRSLVITHYHGDHYGMAGTLLGVTRARMLMHRLDWLIVRNELEDFERAMDRLEGWLRRNGAPPEMIGDEQRRVADMFRRYTVRAPDVELEDEHLIGVGRHEFRVVWTPGHTEGHICLHDPERRVLLSGDHVLDPISPNVSLGRDTGANPLGDYLQSLRKVGALEADLVLPAHGEPFQGLGRRVRELLDHHDEREREVLEALSRGARTGTDVAFALPWTRRRRPLADLALGQQRMAITETLAHLEELRSRDLVVRGERDGLAFYTLAPTASGAAAD
jgi:glyoxylase-like metal-dependent hydrolase (beta-lactamase superfamily II)